MPSLLPDDETYSKLDAYKGLGLETLERANFWSNSKRWISDKLTWKIVQM